MNYFISDLHFGCVNGFDGRIAQQFVEICDYKVLRYSEGGASYQVVLSHYPILMWDCQHKGAILLYGHVHGSPEWGVFCKGLELVNEYFEEQRALGRKDCPEAKAYNVGASLSYIDWCPRTLSTIISKTEGEKTDGTNS